MAELPDFPFVTFHYAHLTHCCLNKTLIMTIRVYSNDQIPFSVSEDWSHSMGFLCSTTNQCSELICLQYSVVVSMNKTNLIIKVAAGGFANGNKWDRTAKMKLDSTVALVTPKWLPSNNDRQGPWTKKKSNAVKKKESKTKSRLYHMLDLICVTILAPF